MSQYEFSQVENQTIAKAALWAKILGGILIGEGVLSLCSNPLTALIDIGMGVSAFQGGSSLQSVVDSQGRDVPLMVEALNKVGTFFMIRLVLLAIVAAIFLCGLIAAITMGGAAALNSL